MGIAVAILPKNKLILEESLSGVVGAICDVQLDIVDGKFAPSTTWPYDNGGIEELREMKASGEMFPMADEFRYEVDLMVEDQTELAGLCIDLGANRVVIHYGPKTGEAIDHIIEKYGYTKGFATDLLSVGVALQIDTPIEEIEQFRDKIDFVQLMGIAHIGKQGEEFDRKVIERVRKVSKKYKDLKVQVDGGVSLATAPALLSSGADRLISGSAILKSGNPRATIKKFEEMFNEYGVFL